MHVVMHTVPLHADAGTATTTGPGGDYTPRTKSIYQNRKKGLFYFIVLIQSKIIMLINEVWLFDSTKHRG
jgi:hypothetical protein